MKGDFTKQTFRPEKHYSSVRMQQGRVQTDADWNEQADIMAYFQSLMAQDLFGQSGAPNANSGFRIDAVRSGSTVTGLTLSAGRFYVNGLVCETETPISLLAQPDFPALGPVTPFYATPGTYLIYIDAWPRHITALEDPSIREPALGGVDTGTRVKTVWQVKTKALSSQSGVTSDLANARQWSTSAPRLAAEYAALVAPPGGLLSAGRDPGAPQLDNRLYRVEVHSSSSSALCLKWSRDNGSLAFRYSFVSDSSVTVGGVAIDTEDGLAVWQILELTDDAHELRGEPGVLMQITDIASQVGIGLSLSLQPIATDPPLVQPSLSSLALSPASCKLRRWDGVQVVSPPPPAGTLIKIPLELGLFVQLHGGTYRPHDYWQLVTRTDTGVDWPLAGDGTPLKQPPRGIQHFCAPLALVQVDITNQISRLLDVRMQFPALTDTASASSVAALSAVVNDSTTGLAAHDAQLRALNSAVLDPNTGLSRHEARLNSMNVLLDNMQEDLAATGAVTGAVRIGTALRFTSASDSHRILELREFGWVTKGNVQAYFGPPKVELFQNAPQVSLAITRLQPFGNIGPSVWQPTQDYLGQPLLAKPNLDNGAADATPWAGVLASAFELSSQGSSTDGFQFLVIKDRLMRLDNIYGAFTAVGRVRSIIGIAATMSPDGGVDIFVSTRMRDLRQLNRSTSFNSGSWNVLSSGEFWGPPTVVCASTGYYSVMSTGAFGRMLEVYRLSTSGALQPTWVYIDHDPRRVDAEKPANPTLPNSSTPDTVLLANPGYEGNTSVMQADYSNPGPAPTKPYRFPVVSSNVNWDYINDPIVLTEGGEYNPHLSSRRGQMFAYTASGKVLYTHWSNDPTRIGANNLVEYNAYLSTYASFVRGLNGETRTLIENSAFASGGSPFSPQLVPPRHTYGTVLFPYRRPQQPGGWVIAEMRATPGGWTWSPNFMTLPWNSTTSVPSITQVAVYPDSDAVSRRFLVAASGALYEHTLSQSEGARMRALGIVTSSTVWHGWTQGANLAQIAGGPGNKIVKVALAITRAVTQSMPVWYGNSGTYMLPTQPSLPCSAFCVDTSGALWEVFQPTAGTWSWRSYGLLPGTKPGCDPTATLMPQAGGTYLAVGYIAGQNGRIFELKNGTITDLGRPY